MLNRSHSQAILFLCVVSLSVVNSCTVYQHMPTLPTTPCLTDQGIELQGAVGTNHLEAQASVSPVKHLTLSYGEFWSNSKKSKGRYAAVQGYVALNKRQTLFLQGNVGFERAKIFSAYEDRSLLAQYVQKYQATSSYDLHKFGAGFIWKQSGSFQLSLEMKYTQANFYQLGFVEEKKMSTSWQSYYTWENNAPVVVPIWTPTITTKFVIGPMFVKQSFVYNIYPMTSVDYTKKAKPERMPNGQFYTRTYPDRRRLAIDEFVFMVSFGYTLDWKRLRSGDDIPFPIPFLNN